MKNLGEEIELEDDQEQTEYLPPENFSAGKNIPALLSFYQSSLRVLSPIARLRLN